MTIQDTTMPPLPTSPQTSGKNTAWFLRRLERFTRFQKFPVPPLGDFDRALLAFTDARYDRIHAEKQGDSARAAELSALMEAIKPQINGRGYMVVRGDSLLCAHCDRLCEQSVSPESRGRCAHQDCTNDVITHIIPRPALALPRIMEHFSTKKLELEDMVRALDLSTDDEIVNVVRAWKIGWAHEQPLPVRVRTMLQVWRADVNRWWQAVRSRKGASTRQAEQSADSGLNSMLDDMERSCKGTFRLRGESSLDGLLESTANNDELDALIRDMSDEDLAALASKMKADFRAKYPETEMGDLDILPPP